MQIHSFLKSQSSGISGLLISLCIYMAMNSPNLAFRQEIQLNLEFQNFLEISFSDSKYSRTRISQNHEIQSQGIALRGGQMALFESHLFTNSSKISQWIQDCSKSSCAFFSGLSHGTFGFLIPHFFQDFWSLLRRFFGDLLAYPRVTSQLRAADSHMADSDSDLRFTRVGLSADFIIIYS